MHLKTHSHFIQRTASLVSQSQDSIPDFGEPTTEPQQLLVSQFPWEFGYHSVDWFLMIHWINKSPNVTAINVIYGTEFGDIVAENDMVDRVHYGPRIGEEYVIFGGSLKSTKIEITLNIYTSNILCSSLLVAKGREVANVPTETPMKAFLYYGIVTNYGCVLVVDLINKCDGPPLDTERKMNTTTENTVTPVETVNPTITSNASTNLEIATNKTSARITKNAKPSHNNVLIYVLASVIGMCVIILLIYLLWVKKYCHRNSQPVETMELNTYSTAKEVVYADLGFVHRDSEPPKRDEESLYAKIIGVLKPTDGNVKNK